MSRTISNADKQQLLDHGLWDEYRHYYACLKDTGARPAAARDQALAMFREVMEGTLSVQQLYGTDGRPVSNPRGTVPPAPTSPPQPEDVSSDAVPFDIAALKRKKPARPMVEFRWVLRNIDEPTVDMDSCPDYEAFKVLRYCNENPAMFRDLLAEYERRGFSRDNGEDRHDTPLDGDEIIADIEKLQKAGVLA